jgi:hypothetical protein
MCLSLAYFSRFEKVKRGLWDHLPVCLSIPLPVFLCNSLIFLFHSLCGPCHIKGKKAISYSRNSFSFHVAIYIFFWGGEISCVVLSYQIPYGASPCWGFLKSVVLFNLSVNPFYFASYCELLLVLWYLLNYYFNYESMTLPFFLIC